MKEQIEAAYTQYGNIDNGNESENKASFEPSGRKKEINGMMCELFKGTDANNNYQHIWSAKSVDDDLIESFNKMSELLSQLNPEEGSENEFDFIVKNNSIPIITMSMSGAEMIEIEEIVKIEKMDISQMMQQGFE